MAKKHKQLPRGVNYAQVLAAEKREKEAKAKQERQLELKFNAEIYVQRALWLSAVSIAEAYGFGPKRMEAYFMKLKENSDDFDRMREENDYDYALEKLRQRAEEVTGAKLDYLYEKELREIEDRKDG
jgi:predicted ATPase